MATTITDIPVLGVSEKRLTLSNSAWAGKFSFGTNWTRIRIGMRFSLADSGASITGTPRLYIGLLANPVPGLTNSPLTATTSHFAGCTTTAGTWTRGIQTTVNDYDVGASAVRFMKRSGSLETLNAAVTNGFPFRNILTAGAYGGRINGLLDITRTLPTASGSIFAVTGHYHSTGETDIPDEASYRNTEIEPPGASYLASFGANYISVTMATAFPVLEGNDGYFDSVCVAWNRSNPVMYFSDISVIKQE